MTPQQEITRQCRNRLGEIHVIKIDIEACGIVDNKYAMVIHSTAIEYEFIIANITINGHHANSTSSCNESKH